MVRLQLLAFAFLPSVCGGSVAATGTQCHSSAESCQHEEELAELGLLQLNDHRRATTDANDAQIESVELDELLESEQDAIPLQRVAIIRDSEIANDEDDWDEDELEEERDVIDAEMTKQIQALKRKPTDGKLQGLDDFDAVQKRYQKGLSSIGDGIKFLNNLEFIDKFDDMRKLVDNGLERLKTSVNFLKVGQLYNFRSAQAASYMSKLAESQRERISEAYTKALANVEEANAAIVDARKAGPVAVGKLNPKELDPVFVGRLNPKELEQQARWRAGKLEPEELEQQVRWRAVKLDPDEFEQQARWRAVAEPSSTVDREQIDLGRETRSVTEPKQIDRKISLEDREQQKRRREAVEIALREIFSQFETLRREDLEQQKKIRAAVGDQDFKPSDSFAINFASLTNFDKHEERFQVGLKEFSENLGALNKLRGFDNFDDMMAAIKAGLDALKTSLDYMKFGAMQKRRAMKSMLNLQNLANSRRKRASVAYEEALTTLDEASVAISDGSKLLDTDTAVKVSPYRRKLQRWWRGNMAATFEKLSSRFDSLSRGDYEAELNKFYTRKLGGSRGRISAFKSRRRYRHRYFSRFTDRK